MDGFQEYPAPPDETGAFSSVFFFVLLPNNDMGATSRDQKMTNRID
jgi:hypothetical protein